MIYEIFPAFSLLSLVSLIPVSNFRLSNALLQQLLLEKRGREREKEEEGGKRALAVILLLTDRISHTRCKHNLSLSLFLLFHSLAVLFSRHTREGRERLNSITRIKSGSRNGRARERERGRSQTASNQGGGRACV